jgi:hypothetical protein
VVIGFCQTSNQLMCALVPHSISYALTLGAIGTVSVLLGTVLAYIANRSLMYARALEMSAGFVIIGGLAMVALGLQSILSIV